MASAGKILLMPKGVYDSETTYSVLDWVRYGGKAWVCKQNSTGNTPAENTYWTELCADGGGGGTGAWGDITGKPFNSVGSDGLKVASGILDVDLTKVQTILNDATTSVSGKMSATDKAKLEGIADNANNYSLPTASETVKGGAKIAGTDGLTMDGEVLKAAIKGLITSENDFDAQTGSTSQSADSYLLKLLLDLLKGTVLTGTLTAAATSITFTDAAIVTDDTVMYTVRNNKGVNYTAQSLSAGSLTLTYPAQATNMAVLLIIQEV